MNMMIGMGLMLAGSLVWIIWFLKNPLADNGIDLRQSNIDLGKQRKTELQLDFNQGLIDKQQFDLALREISSTLAVELKQENIKIFKPENTSISIWVIAILLPVFSIYTYQHLSNFTPADKAAIEPTPLSLEQSVVDIQQYLIKNPKDVDALMTLGLSYIELGQVQKALQVYEKAYQINPKDPRLLVEYASVLISANDDQFSARPIELVKQALAIEPNAPDALYLAGMFAVSMQDFNLAKGLWTRALNALPKNSEDRQTLLGILEELKYIESEQLSHKIVVNVAISDAILSSRKDDYLMIYAKAAKGRPMPIAIQKLKLKDFSGQITLSDINSIMPTNPLSKHDKVLLVARLSRTGSAMKQTGDIQVVSGVVSVSNNPNVALKINE